MNNQTILIAIVALLIGGIGGYAIADKNKSYEERGYNKEVSDNIPMGMHRMPDGTMMGDADTSVGGMSQMDHMMAMMVSSGKGVGYLFMVP